MFISCLHSQQPQSIKQFISKLSCRTALNYIQHMCTGWVEKAESQTPNQIPTNFLVESREMVVSGRGSLAVRLAGCARIPFADNHLSHCRGNASVATTTP